MNLPTTSLTVKMWAGFYWRSLFASNIGSEHLIGLAGSGFAEGLPVARYEILAGLAQLFLYLQSVQAYIAPTITAVFLVGLFYKRLNSTGAISSLISGFVLGFLRFFLELYKDSLSGFWYELATINFLHFALLLFVICTVILITVSLFTPVPVEEEIKDVIYHKTINGTQVTKRSTWFTFGLLGIIVFLWIYLS